MRIAFTWKLDVHLPKNSSGGPVWILTLNVWNDAGIWKDAASWLD